MRDLMRKTLSVGRVAARLLGRGPGALRLAAVFVLALCPAARSAAQGVTKIAETSATGGLGLSVPAINNGGAVAFVDTTSGHTGLFVGSGGPLTTIDTTKVYGIYLPGDRNGFGPSINDLGRAAAVVGLAQTPESIISGSGGPLTTIATADGTPISGTGTVILSRPTIAPDGTTAFAAYHSGGFAGNGVFSGTGGPLTTIAVNSNSSAQLTVAPYSSSDGSYLAYVAPATGTSSKTASVLHNGVTTSVTLPGNLSNSFFAHVAVNNSGMLAGTTIHGGNGGLMVGDGTTTLLTIRSSLNDPSSPFTDFDAVSINNSNAIAFLASGGNFTGIFTGPTLGSKIVQTGDALDGSTVTALSFGSEGLNDQGQIAFWAKLADGRQGIYVTTAPVPEPRVPLLTAVAVGGLASLGLARYRRDRRPS